jgi:hypothetical protein
MLGRSWSQGAGSAAAGLEVVPVVFLAAAVVLMAWRGVFGIL